MEQIPVSVIIPAYNAKGRVGTAVSSAWNQMGFRPLEVIVVDDASTDFTADEAEAVGARVIKLTQNGGAATARNKGIEEAKGDWLVMLDADDELSPVCLMTLWPHRYEFDCISGASAWVNEKGEVFRKGGTQRKREVIRTPRRLVFPGNDVSATGTLVRRSQLVRLNGYDTTKRLSEDFDLWVRLLERTPVLMLATITSFYNQHPGQKTNDKTRLRAARVNIVDGYKDRQWYSKKIAAKAQAVIDWDALRAHDISPIAWVSSFRTQPVVKLTATGELLVRRRRAKSPSRLREARAAYALRESTPDSPDSPKTPTRKTAFLLSTNAFEEFYGTQIGITPGEFLSTYRNDWAWMYAETLRAHDIDASIYVASTNESGKHRTSDGYDVRFLPLNRVYALWTRIPLVRKKAIGRFVTQIINTLSMWKSLRAAVKDDQLDLLMVQEYWTSRFDLLALMFKNVPVVAMDHGLIDKREVKVFKRAAMKRVPVITTQSLEQFDKVNRYGGNAVEVPNGVDTRFFTPPSKPTEQKRIITVARIQEYQKRNKDLLRTLATLPKEWTLDVVGDGPDRAAFEKLAEQMEVSDRVTMHGYVMDRSKVRDLYWSAAVFALPSKYEGMPLAVLEAMACGLPVVATEIPSLQRVMREGKDGILVPIGDTGRFATALKDVWKQREAFSANARQRIVDEYSLERLGERLTEVIDLSSSSSSSVRA